MTTYNLHSNAIWLAPHKSFFNISFTPCDLVPYRSLASKVLLYELRNLGLCIITPEDSKVTRTKTNNKDEK